MHSTSIKVACAKNGPYCFLPSHPYLNACNHRFCIASPKMWHMFKHGNENEINVIHALQFIEEYEGLFPHKMHSSKFKRKHQQQLRIEVIKMVEQ